MTQSACHIADQFIADYFQPETTLADLDRNYAESLAYVVHLLNTCTHSTNKLARLLKSAVYQDAKAEFGAAKLARYPLSALHTETAMSPAQAADSYRKEQAKKEQAKPECAKCGGPRHRNSSGDLVCQPCLTAGARARTEAIRAGLADGTLTLPEPAPCRTCGAERRRDPSGRVQCYPCKKAGRNGRRAKETL